MLVIVFGTGAVILEVGMSETEPPNPAPASTLVIDGRYRLLRLIGIGGMGAVYEAEHVAIGRRVAVKILHTQFSKHADLVERLRREAQAASRIGHPNIVDVTDFGRTEDGSAYLAMEFLHGTDLGAILRERGSLSEARAIHIGLQTVQALAAAHREGVVHRDLKPENIFIINPRDWLIEKSVAKAAAISTGPRSGGPPSSSPTNSIYDLVKVLDFGIAVQLGSPMAEPSVAVAPVLRSGRLTNPGLTVGTPDYMAPEQATGSHVDARADIYAVGTLLYEMICGRVPFIAPSVPELLTMKTEQPAPTPRVFMPAISPPLEALILRCLDRDPNSRPQTMEAVEAALLDMAAGASQESPAARSSDMVGRVAVPTPSSMTPAATSEELSAPSTGAAKVSPRFLRAGRAALALLAGGLIVVGFASARYVVRRAQRPPPQQRAAPAGAARVSFAAPDREPAGLHPAMTAMAPLPAPPSPESRRPPAPAPAHEDAHEEVRMLLEWARRAAAGRRYTAPPGDNLKELLARIEAIPSASDEARALHDETTRSLGKRLHEELRRRHALDALESYRALRALDPSHRLEAPKRELLYQLLFLARTGRRGVGHEIMLLAAHGAVEVAPAHAAAHLALADALLAAGRREAAAVAYRRVLELRPRLTERRLAEQGLGRLGKSSAPIDKHKPHLHAHREHHAAD